jgi:hypothetical protein
MAIPHTLGLHFNLLQWCREEFWPKCKLSHVQLQQTTNTNLPSRDACSNVQQGITVLLTISSLVESAFVALWSICPLSTSGPNGGIGLKTEYVPHLLGNRVVEITPGGNAEKSEIVKLGDVIVEVDGTSVL